MSDFRIESFATDLHSDLAENLGEMFERNYPEMHGQNERDEDIRRHSGQAAIRGLFDEGRTLYVASLADEGTVAGFVETKTVDIPAHPYVFEQMSWMMVDRRFRGLGLASMLHEQFIGDATARSYARLPRRTFAQLRVHSLNPAYDVYRGWGYNQAHASLDRNVVMLKSLSTDE